MPRKIQALKSIKATLLLPMITIVSLSASAADLKLAMTPTLTYAIVEKIVDTCIAKQIKEKGAPIFIAVYDGGANLVSLRKMDNATMGSGETAMMKAEGAARFPYPTREVATWVAGKDGKGGNAGVAHIPGLAAFTGGLPIITANGMHIGGVGVSGADSNVDEDCARAGIEAVKLRWKK